VAGSLLRISTGIRTLVPLDDLQQAMKRQDLSLVAIVLAPATPSRMWTNSARNDWIWNSSHAGGGVLRVATEALRPVRTVAWWWCSGSGRRCFRRTQHDVRRRRGPRTGTGDVAGSWLPAASIAVALVRSGTAGGRRVVARCSHALSVVHGAAVRFTMGAFTLRIDSVTMLVGCTAACCSVSRAPSPAIRAMRLPWSMVSGGLTLFSR